MIARHDHQPTQTGKRDSQGYGKAAGSWVWVGGGGERRKREVGRRRWEGGGIGDLDDGGDRRGRRLWNGKRKSVEGIK